MRALIAAPETADGFRLADVPEPVPRPGQALVEVRHASVNFGEVRYLGFQPAGGVLGFDAAGYVVQPAEDGTGPAEGARVAALGAGAWAQRAAFDTGSLAVVPDGLDLAQAAALPLVGITALRTLRAAGSVLGRRVLVTGAAGGVGRLAVQLARLGGAHVIASVGSAPRTEGLAALGAHEVVVGLEHIDQPVDVVLENVGGEHLTTAWRLLKPGGSLQSIGWASGEPAVFPPNSIFALGPARTLQSFGDASHPGPDLADLLALAAAGTLEVQVGWQDSWGHIADAITALLGRQVSGKAVIDID
ncbi:zinc-binding dehydrogenase [Phytohabitans houttuyneae]|uniref:Oxidoreductase n=1 Tax=Phytohabitans houttuyneae TaxID=1076126 RepID=A0A6V8KQ48_9ACTN|nr:zinc-binding dehydrogenase [Phytohabitans houttuyneae]GFJ83867.1 oxidoreductase [Phytohabitans houttuyneae]